MTYYLRLAAVSAILMSVSGCGIHTKETTATGMGPSDCCYYMPVITFSDDDTIETQDLIVDYLITREALCE